MPEANSIILLLCSSIFVGAFVFFVLWFKLLLSKQKLYLMA